MPIQNERLPNPASVCPAVDEPTFVSSYAELIDLVGEGEAALHRNLIAVARNGIWLVPHPEYSTDGAGTITWKS